MVGRRQLRLEFKPVADRLFGLRIIALADERIGQIGMRVREFGPQRNRPSATLGGIRETAQVAVHGAENVPRFGILRLTLHNLQEQFATLFEPPLFQQGQRVSA